MPQLSELVTAIAAPSALLMMRIVRRLSIGIVGCGVGGCTAALLLAGQGHAVTLFEQTPRVGPIGAGVLLQTSGQRVLKSLGLLNTLSDGAERIDELVAFTHGGKLLSRLRFADLPGGHFALGIHRGDLFATLHATVIQAGVDLRLNHLVAKTGCDGNLFDSAKKALGRFDLIVSADGSRSGLRASLKMRAFIHHYKPAALWAVVNQSSVQHRLLQHARHTRQLCGMLPMGRGRTSFFWGLNLTDWPRLRQSSFQEWQLTVIS